MRQKQINNSRRRWATFSFVVFAMFALIGYTNAAGISASDKWAWSNQGGWINFNPSNGNVDVTDSSITGHIWSPNFGWINLQPSNGGVTNACDGHLSG